MERALCTVSDKGTLAGEQYRPSFIRKAIEILVGGKSHKSPALVEFGPHSLLTLSSYSVLCYGQAS